MSEILEPRNVQKRPRRPHNCLLDVRNLPIGRLRRNFLRHRQAFPLCQRSHDAAHVVNNNDGHQLVSRDRVRIESILGNFFFRAKCSLCATAHLLETRRSPRCFSESIRKSMEQSKVFRRSRHEKKERLRLQVCRTLGDVKEVFIEATSRAAYLCVFL